MSTLPTTFNEVSVPRPVIAGWLLVANDPVIDPAEIVGALTTPADSVPSVVSPPAVSVPTIVARFAVTLLVAMLAADAFPVNVAVLPLSL